MEKRIRVLTVIRHPVGGIRTYLKYTYGNLIKDRYRFTILTVEDEEGGLVENDLKDLSVDVVRTGGPWRVPAMIWTVCRLCFQRRVDVVHSQGATAGVLALIGNWLGKVPHVVTLHDVLRQDQFTGWGGGLKKWMLGLLLKRIDVIYCVSEDVRQNLLEFLPALARQESKCVVITNGVATHPVPNGASDYRRALHLELGLGQDTVIFGFFGRFMPQKGFTSLIDATEALARDSGRIGDFKVLAVNDGAFIREYKALIRDRGLTEYFVFYGFTPEIDRMILGVDAVVIPSLWEASSLVAMEAFVLGCPVVASPCIGLREVVKDTPAVVLNKVGDSEGLASALQEVIRNRTKLQSEAAAYSLRARERFDVRKTSAQLHALLCSMAQRGSPPA